MSSISIISWNVNGLRAVYQKGFMQWFHRANPAILCLQETKCHAEQLPAELCDIPGYQVHYSSGERKGYSGTALYSKPQPLEVSEGMGVPEFDGEGRLIIARYPDFTLANCYFPNGKASPERLRFKLAFYEAFQQHLAARRKQGERFIVTGDVNTAHQPLDLAHPKQNEKISGFLPEERAWIDRFLAPAMWMSIATSIPTLWHTPGGICAPAPGHGMWAGGWITSCWIGNYCPASFPPPY